MVDSITDMKDPTIYVVIARSEATKQSSFSFFTRQAGLLRCARNDDFRLLDVVACSTSMFDPENPPRFRRARNLAAGAARARRDALDQLAVRCYLCAVGLIEGVFKPGAQMSAQISAALMQRPDFRPPDRRDLPMGFRRFQLQEDRQQFRIGRHARGDAHYEIILQRPGIHAGLPVHADAATDTGVAAFELG